MKKGLIDKEEKFFSRVFDFISDKKPNKKIPPDNNNKLVSKRITNKNRSVKKNKFRKEISRKTQANNEEVKFMNIQSPHIKKTKVREQEYIKTGINGFDSLIKDGIPVGASVLVEGGPGSGKTVFCLNLAEKMCAKGKKVLYMSFEEPEYQLDRHMKNFGIDYEKYKNKKLLYVKRFNALDIARSVEALLSEAKKELLIDVQPILIPREFQPEIVVIDSLTSIGSAFSGEESRFRIYMEQLFRYLEGHNITSFLIRECANPTHTGNLFVEKGEAVSFLSDGIIVLYNVYSQGIRKRAIEVLKMRGVEIDRKIVECDVLRKKGFVVYPNKILKGSYILT